MVEYERVLRATIGTFGAFAIVAFLLQVDIARGYLAIALPLGLALLIVGRALWRAALHRMRRDDRCMTGAIVVGGEEDVLRVLQQLARNYRVGYRAIAVSLPGDRRPPVRGRRDRRRCRSSRSTRWREISKRTRTRAVIVAGGIPGGNDAIRELGWQLENSKVELILMSRLTDVAGPRIHMRPINGLPMVHVDLPQYSGFNHAIKRLFDMALAGLALLVLSPVFGAIALAIRLDDSGPVLFRQQRVGAHGSHFTLLKFRSMVVDAEARLEALRAQSEGNGVLFKMKDDPRITRVGALPAQVLARRAAAAVERAARRHEPRRAAPAAAGRGRAVRVARQPAAAHPPGHHRALAGQRALEPVVGGERAARSLLRRELVDHGRHRRAREDRESRHEGGRRLLASFARQGGTR